MLRSTPAKSNGVLDFPRFFTSIQHHKNIAEGLLLIPPVTECSLTFILEKRFLYMLNST